jgi:hypothetical protein
VIPVFVETTSYLSLSEILPPDTTELGVPERLCFFTFRLLAKSNHVSNNTVFKIKKRLDVFNFVCLQLDIHTYRPVVCECERTCMCAIQRLKKKKWSIQIKKKPYQKRTILPYVLFLVTVAMFVGQMEPNEEVL